jgi:hypothetical protein
MEEYNTQRTYARKCFFGKPPWKIFPDSKELSDAGMLGNLQVTVNPVNEALSIRWYPGFYKILSEGNLG